MRPITASAGTSPIAALPSSTMRSRVSINASSTPTTAIAMRLNSRMRLRWKITVLPSPRPSPKGEGERRRAIIARFAAHPNREKSMEFSIKSGNPEKQRTACIVVGGFEGRRLADGAQAIDGATRRALTEVLRRGDHAGKLGSTLLLQRLGRLPAERVLLVGLGRERDFGEA